MFGPLDRVPKDWRGHPITVGGHVLVAYRKSGSVYMTDAEVVAIDSMGVMSARVVNDNGPMRTARIGRILELVDPYGVTVLDG